MDSNSSTVEKIIEDMRADLNWQKEEARALDVSLAKSGHSRTSSNAFHDMLSLILSETGRITKDVDNAALVIEKDKSPFRSLLGMKADVPFNRIRDEITANNMALMVFLRYHHGGLLSRNKKPILTEPVGPKSERLSRLISEEASESQSAEPRNPQSNGGDRNLHRNGGGRNPEGIGSGTISPPQRMPPEVITELTAYLESRKLSQLEE
ncbi:hypothetical protein BCR41DRAFT_419218 [Lobosporangium transversale]|uniref:Uncharacterized protein n=1 Tax=Lobosporangium transversale TaxID=64571 RepID=A0A1Y2GYR9_9FUNG|nr:hypothetical protein BCR41DRAFT_419218 [Lobosporangium transversale]ORZ27450.1 hypothetical protein BCR41DRAFT_419218 [Lobosporangium transversale]|eukprot:XP_021885177.1 hypothetical protein BCR41DRAFT_419218 [Lobosporangium transversale]